jgi:hypothetical protein
MSFALQICKVAESLVGCFSRTEKEDDRSPISITVIIYAKTKVKLVLLLGHSNQLKPSFNKRLQRLYPPGILNMTLCEENNQRMKPANRRVVA